MLRVARDKALAVADRAGGDGLHAGGGHGRGGRRTRFWASRRIADGAPRMLTLLSGTIHEVLTARRRPARRRGSCEVVSTRVRFVDLSEYEIDWYLESGEPEGKAGAYGIQGRASRFVDWIEGSWSNVVGLPVATVYRMLDRRGRAMLT